MEYIQYTTNVHSSLVRAIIITVWRTVLWIGVCLRNGVDMYNVVVIDVQQQHCHHSLSDSNANGLSDGQLTTRDTNVTLWGVDGCHIGTQKVACEELKI